jgi:antitoxin ParD1/3/4
MNVSLGSVWEKYVAEQVASGHFNNASEVVRDALRMQQEHQVKFEALKRDVLKGVESIEAGRIRKVSARDFLGDMKSRRRGG